MNMSSSEEPDLRRFCGHCKALLCERRWRNGKLESPAQLRRRKYCDRKCSSQACDAKPSLSRLPSTTHHHARKLVPPGPCARCGRPNAIDVHHRDRDHTNNSLDNLERICRKCHIAEHRAKRICILCDAPHRCRGYCSMHYRRFKTWGDPLIRKRADPAKRVSTKLTMIDAVEIRRLYV